VAQKLNGAATSVAPPERPPRSPTSSVLPPLPTVSNSRAQVPSGLPPHQSSAPSTTVAAVDYSTGISDHSSGPLTAADDVQMNSPLWPKPIERGRQENRNGASKSFGGILRGNAVGNVSNIGDWDLCNKSPDHIELDATVNLFVSMDQPTSLNIDESAIMSVQLPYEEKLASVLTGVARCYSPV
ncbi:hypothetical protein CVT25_013640, partial [Psilocybe cyanescens]